jgi:Zn-dependent alcohol dehydrogenase
VKGRTELPGIVEGRISVITDAMRLQKGDLFTHPFFSFADYLQGKIKVDEYITHAYKFADINKGFDAMHVRSALLSEKQVWFA